MSIVANRRRAGEFCTCMCWTQRFRLPETERWCWSHLQIAFQPVHPVPSPSSLPLLQRLPKRSSCRHPALLWGFLPQKARTFLRHTSYSTLVCILLGASCCSQNKFPMSLCGTAEPGCYLSYFSPQPHLVSFLSSCTSSSQAILASTSQTCPAQLFLAWAQCCLPL